MSIMKIALVQVVIGAVVITGYVKNIVKLSNCDFKAPYKAEVIHAIGIVPPVGCITGWLSIDDTPIIITNAVEVIN